MRAVAATAAVAAASLAFASSAHAIRCEDVASKIRQPDRFAPLVVGDSVTVPAGPFLGDMGFAVDAVACRTFAQGLEVMAQRRLPDVVVIALGSNAEVSGTELQRALELVGQFARLVLVLPKELGGDPDPDGRIMREFERAYPDQVEILDWPQYSAGHGGWFAPDGLHITTDGARGFARMIGEAVEFGPPEEALPAPEPRRRPPPPRPAERPEPPGDARVARLWEGLGRAVAAVVAPGLRLIARLAAGTRVAPPDL